MTAGLLCPGTVLYKSYRQPRMKSSFDQTTGSKQPVRTFESVSQAARLMTGQKTVNGRAFWLTKSGVPVGDLRRGLKRVLKIY